LHATPPPAGELPGRLWRPSDDRGDFLEGHSEHVVQYEGQPFGRSQRFEYHEQREPDGVGEHRFLLGVGFGVEADDRFGEPAADVVLLARAARPQDVEADAADDGGEPAAEVGDRLGVGTAQSQPGLLEGVIGVAERAEHAVGDCPQVRPVLLEPLDLPALLVHGHILKSESVIAVTNQP
jgi:hypothetical protein